MASSKNTVRSGSKETFDSIRKPIAPPAKVMKTKKDYNRQKAKTIKEDDNA